MYTRGQLALIGNLGRKAIRLYEQEGLITSSRIDDGNGYHYYDEEQIVRLKKIKEYKNLGLSLTEIHQILCNEATEEEILLEKKQELDRTIQSMQELRKKMDRTDGNDRLNLRNVTNEINTINVCEFSECNCLFVEENVEREKLGISVGKLFEQAARNNLKIAGSHFVKYEGLMKADGDFTMTTCLPILPTDSSKELQNIRFEENKKCLHMNFTGGFSKVGNAHEQMKNYMDRENMIGTGTVYEVYNQNMSVDIYYEVCE